MDEAGLREMIKQDTRHFAKRQLTWFRREPSVTWVDFFPDTKRRCTFVYA